MKHLILTLSLFALTLSAGAQCLTNSLIVNTGYNPLTNAAITPGSNGGTPAPDPHWTVTAVSPAVTTAIASTPITGLIPVAIGGNADVVTGVGSWVVNPAGNPGGWISCLNSNTYYDLGTGLPYSMTLGRSFRMCSDDNIKLDLHVADDNYCSLSDIDGVPLSFSQPAVASASFYSTYAAFTQTVFLTAGVHTLHFTVNNYNVSSVTSNPTGLNVYGTVSSATGSNSLVSESYLTCSTYPCSQNCNNTVTLADTLKDCVGNIDTLKAVISGTDSILTIRWSPPTALSDTTIADPVITMPGTASWYYITIKSLLPWNLVYNGDFSAGNTGFSSSYTYSAPPSSILLEGFYSVYTDPHGVHSGFTSFGDHTTGTGNMMILNGASSPVDVWCETIPVLPNTDYIFSSWFANCSSADVGAGAPILQFKINGVLQGTPITVSAAPGTWENFYTTWNSGTSTTATICIYDGNTIAGGNDFVIDDISFQQICTIKDSIYVQPILPDTTQERHDTVVCANVGSITLTAPVNTTYHWNTGATTQTISVSAAGNYWVYLTNGCSTLIDTFHLTYKALPVVNLGNDTAFCEGDTLKLTSVQPSGDTLLWSNGSAGSSVSVFESGTWWLQVSNGCLSADTIHITVSPHPVVDLGPDTALCFTNSLVLQSSVSYTSPVYLWSNASIAPSIIVNSTGTYWLQVSVNGCTSADTINVALLHDTLQVVTPDTAICLGASVSVLVNANPAAAFQWLPTAGVLSPNAAGTTINADTSALYVIRASMAGCPDIFDSIYIDVQPHPSFFLGGTRQMCQYDSIHLQGLVTPQWYTHYSYAWSPSTGLNDTDQSATIFTATDILPHKIYLNVTTPAGCSALDSIQLIIYPGNFAQVDSDFAVCPGDSVQLHARGGVSYEWHPATYLSNAAVAMPWIWPETSQAYSVIATSAYGCLDTAWLQVTVHPNAVIHMPDSVQLYPGESYQISPETNCSSFRWTPPGGLSSAYISNPLASPEISTIYFVRAQTEYGCKVQDSISIDMADDAIIGVPNAFTPGAATNNEFKIILRGIATLKDFRIYDRWGVLVFSTHDINQGWDGTFKGVPQPIGVYVYQLDVETMGGKAISKKGNVTLIR